MAGNQQKGRLGEDAALALLQSKGMTLIGRNLRVGQDEIDLLLREGALLVFTEVKLRTKTEYPRAAVDAAKQKRICRAALRYMVENGLLGQGARFDVVEVFYQDGRMTLQHLENAFPFVRGRYFV